MPELAVIVPTRGRPDNIRRLLGAWDRTDAWDVADLVLAIDADDPRVHGYHDLSEENEHPDTGDNLFRVFEYTAWQPMVRKLNAAAVALAGEGRYFALGFAGDDHVPRTKGWAQTYLEHLHRMRVGMVYGDDGYQGAALSTEWAVTANAVQAIGAMVPAPVDHLYCDNAMMDLYGGAGMMAHLPTVHIEHLHPFTGKAAADAQYLRVNAPAEYARERVLYEKWRSADLPEQIRALGVLRPKEGV